MQCPYCSHTFRLTWPAYFKTGTSRYICPRCSRAYRLKFWGFGYLIQLVTFVVCGVPGILLLLVWLGPAWCWVGALPAVMAYVLLDKRFDDEHRDSKTIEGDELSDPTACAECKRVFNVQDMIVYEGLHVCPRCKPRFLQKLVEGAKIGSGVGMPKIKKRLPSLFWMIIVKAIAALLISLLFPITSSHTPPHGRRITPRN